MPRFFLAIICVLNLSLVSLSPIAAQDTDNQQAESNSSTEPGAGDKEAPEVLDQRTELDLPEDESIKVSVEPLVVNNLVDRVMEPGVVTVKCPGAQSAEIFVLAVDAPYGGRALSKPRSIGKDLRPGNGLSIPWTSKESDQYVKLFAVVHKKENPDAAVRSHTIDLAIGGSRYEPPKADPNPLNR